MLLFGSYEFIQGRSAAKMDCDLSIIRGGKLKVPVQLISQLTENNERLIVH